MDQAILQACVAKLRESDEPLTVSAIRDRLDKALRFPLAGMKEVGRELDGAAVAKWPAYRSQKARYWHRELADCVLESVLEFLSCKPATLEQSAGEIRKHLPGVSKARTETEVKTILPGLLADGRVHQEVLARKAWYFSQVWARGIGGSTDGPLKEEDELKKAVLQSVESLESAPGNYVAVYKLRIASAVNTRFDEAVIALAEEGRLVLTEYDGPRPVPDEKAHEYVKDEQGRLYIGIARPRRED